TGTSSPRRLSMCASTMPPPPKLHVMTALGANRSAAQSKICSAVHLSACLEIVFNSFIFIDSSPRPSLCYERAAARVRVAGPGPDRSDELCRKVRRRPRQRAKGRRRGRCGDEGPCRRGPRDPGTPAGAAAAGGARGLRRPKGAFDETSRFRRRGGHRAPGVRLPAGKHGGPVGGGRCHRRGFGRRVVCSGTGRVYAAVAAGGGSRAVAGAGRAGLGGGGGRRRQPLGAPRGRGGRGVAGGCGTSGRRPVVGGRASAAGRAPGGGALGRDSRPVRGGPVGRVAGPAVRACRGGRGRRSRRRARRGGPRRRRAGVAGAVRFASGSGEASGPSAGTATAAPGS